MDEFFYGTLPQDTQDFTQVLKGVRRSIGDVARGVSYYPYDLIGAPVDIINMALTPVGLGSQQPVMGSDYLRNIGKSLGLAQDPTGSIPETTARIGAGFINPAAGARAVGQIPQAITRGANVSADKLVQMITQNPRATAMGVIDETSMPFMQAMTPKPPGLMEPAKSDIGFYSQLEAATIPLQNKGTGDQYLAQIQKSAGVKPEEIQWTGLDEFLKGKKSVTKTEIQDYLNANRVDVQEVRLGEPTPEDVRLFMEDEAGQGYDYEDALDYLRGSGDAPKFSSYTLPGGENYREILLTLPQKLGSKDDISQRMFGKPYKELTDQERFQVTPEFQKTMGQDFQSTHFDQPNILAHMRVNDRVVDGKKTLFIEEVQSDWHQAGRKKGYNTPEARAAEQQKLDNILVERQALLDEQRRLEELAQPFTSQGKDAPREIVDQWSIISNRLNNLQTEQNRLGRGFGQQVPDAPFKTSWHELTLKRAIQEASEKGYDQIAFTTGKTQAERYDLSKQVDTLRAPFDNGEYAVSYIPKGGNEYEYMGRFLEKDLPGAVGKELAEKIVANKGIQSMTYKGDDLRIGGEGMKGFYDQILPKSLEKLGKKFDAKVGKTFIEGERTRDADGFPSMYPEKIEVWKMDITPKMRESVTTKGQPLFAVPAIGAGLLGAGMYQDEQMY